MYICFLKKIVLISLLAVYSIATMGANVHSHFCMNKFVSWSFFEEKDTTCGKCGMKEEDKSGCCKDEHQHYKLDTDHQKSDTALVLHFKCSPQIASIFAPYLFTNYLHNTFLHPSLHAPPDIQKQRLHVLNCVFLI